MNEAQSTHGRGYLLVVGVESAETEASDPEILGEEKSGREYLVCLPSDPGSLSFPTQGQAAGTHLAGAPDHMNLLGVRQTGVEIRQSRLWRNIGNVKTWGLCRGKKEVDLRAFLDNRNLI